MTINHQKKHKRYRVYVSLGHRDSIQKYFGYGANGVYKTQKKAFMAAQKEHQFLQEKHMPADPKKHPFILDIKHREGAIKNCPINIRHISLTLESNMKGISPDWSITKKRQVFHSYPPILLFQKFKYRRGKRVSKQYKRVKVHSSLSWQLSWFEIIDYYLECLPQYEGSRAEMLEAMPDWKAEIWPWLEEKSQRYFDVV